MINEFEDDIEELIYNFLNDINKPTYTMYILNKIRCLWYFNEFTLENLNKIINLNQEEYIELKIRITNSKIKKITPNTIYNIYEKLEISDFLKFVEILLKNHKNNQNIEYLNKTYISNINYIFDVNKMNECIDNHFNRNTSNRNIEMELFEKLKSLKILKLFWWNKDYFGNYKKCKNLDFDKMSTFEYLRSSNCKLLGSTLKTNKLKDFNLKNSSEFDEYLNKQNRNTSEISQYNYPWCKNLKIKLNEMQIICLKQIHNNNENILISSPTCSGKTLVAILGIMKCLFYNINSKIFYVVPIKALITEVVDKISKNIYNDIKVSDVSSDSNMSINSIKNIQICVGTQEKLDMLMRKNFNFDLIIIDEIHLLNSDRGDIIEAIIARFRNRIIGMSATIPNIEDIRKFIRSPVENCLIFGDEYRLNKIKYEYHTVSVGSENDQMIINKAIKENKPLILFVNERSKTLELAKMIYNNLNSKYKKIKNKHFGNLINDQEESIRDVNRKENKLTENQEKINNKDISNNNEIQNLSKRMKIDRINQIKTIEIIKNIQNHELMSLVLYGIAIHHAGLSYNDRNIVETLFRDGVIEIIVSTTTLAWGINLPCSTVMIYGTFNSLEIIQMCGRAGRNISNSIEYKGYYYGPDIEIINFIESKLLVNLDFHLNAQIAIGDIKCFEEAFEWFKRTFYYQRMVSSRKNTDKLIDNDIKQIIFNSLKSLELEFTHRYFIPKINGILSLNYYFKPSQLIRLSEINEFYNESLILDLLDDMIEDPKLFIPELNVNYPYPTNSKVGKIIQFILAGYNLNFDKNSFINNVSRALSCIFEYCIFKKIFVANKVFELLKMIENCKFYNLNLIQIQNDKIYGSIYKKHNELLINIQYLLDNIEDISLIITDSFNLKIIHFIESLDKSGVVNIYLNNNSYFYEKHLNIHLLSKKYYIKNPITCHIIDSDYFIESFELIYKFNFVNFLDENKQYILIIRDNDHIKYNCETVKYSDFCLFIINIDNIKLERTDNNSFNVKLMNHNFTNTVFNKLLKHLNEHKLFIFSSIEHINYDYLISLALFQSNQLNLNSKCYLNHKNLNNIKFFISESLFLKYEIHDLIEKLFENLNDNLSKKHYIIFDNIEYSYEYFKNYNIRIKNRIDVTISFDKNNSEIYNNSYDTLHIFNHKNIFNEVLYLNNLKSIFIYTNPYHLNEYENLFKNIKQLTELSYNLSDNSLSNRLLRINPELYFHFNNIPSYLSEYEQYASVIKNNLISLELFYSLLREDKRIFENKIHNSHEIQLISNFLNNDHLIKNYKYPKNIQRRFYHAKIELYVIKKQFREIIMIKYSYLKNFKNIFKKKTNKVLFEITSFEKETQIKIKNLLNPHDKTNLNVNEYLFLISNDNKHIKFKLKVLELIDGYITFFILDENSNFKRINIYQIGEYSIDWPNELFIFPEILN